MIQAFYSAAVGAQQQMQKMNVQANNIANVNTCGFKAEKPAFQALMYLSLIHILLGAAPGGSTCLRTLNREEMGQWEQEGAPEGACQRISFQEALKSVLQQRRK